MNFRSPRQIDPEKTAEVSALLATGASLEAVVQRMRDLGLNKIESIKLLRNHAGIPLAEGKDMVHLSPAWADRYQSDESLQDSAEVAAASVFTEEAAAA